MSRRVTLVGLDCGTTTTCLVVGQGQLTTSVRGQVDVTEVVEVFRSDVVFTPFDGPRLDGVRLATYLDVWLAGAGVKVEQIFGGGALITGLAAQRENVAEIRRLLASRLDDAVIAAADAPRFESWLAFMGNCHALSLAHPQTAILNLDIGGGTTNLAWGENGEVLATGSLHIGARHLRFEPGTYRIVELSSLGRELLAALDIDRHTGDTLTLGEIERIVSWYVERLREAAAGTDAAESAVAQSHVQAPFILPARGDQPHAITLSGGVGRLAYQLRERNARPAVTEYGDLGAELAYAILRCPYFAQRLTLVPEGQGHATVFGLLRHSTELSGTTLYLPEPNKLPLLDVPIVGRLRPLDGPAHVRELLELANGVQPAVAIQVDLVNQDRTALQGLSELLSQELERHPIPQGTTLVLLVPANLGKSLGHLVTRWGKLDVDLIVLDEVPQRDAQFVRVGRLRETVVPVWLYAVR